MYIKNVFILQIPKQFRYRYQPIRKSQLSATKSNLYFIILLSISFQKDILFKGIRLVTFVDIKTVDTVVVKNVVNF